ncbi:MAG TPA: ferritin-like domain-containing protein [Candidatus Stackebrandtia faecavium]|nr:ferritin-like domain-containing protein [Candidatus Stackebrandtia faecavium]
MADYGISDALQVEYEAIYAFGVTGPLLSGALLDAALVAETRHREQRDAAVAHLVDAEEKVPGAKAAYTVPFELTVPADAVKLITEVEYKVATAWRMAIANTAGDGRRLAAEILAQSAVNAARWRRAQGEAPTTIPFPGRP